MSAEVLHRSYSLALQRSIADFGADHAFLKVAQKIKEHYGIDIPVSAARKITLLHASTISEQQAQARTNTIKNGAKRHIISETDGSMVPIVSIVPSQSDRRKKKTLHYREARLTLAHELGSATPVFSATFGDPATAGLHIAYCVRRVGMNNRTHIHGVGDGAPWIADQIEKQFGSQASYLIDFYHVCEYLAKAAHSCAPTQPTQWVESQKLLLKDSRIGAVLLQLKPFLEPESLPDAEAPVRCCYRYLNNRIGQLDYKNAIEKELPIGSGEVESAHRYIIQERLKLPGAWWLEENAEQMLALRTHRANNDWSEYWSNLAA